MNKFGEYSHMVSLFLKPSLKLEAVFQQRQIHQERLRPRGLDFRDNHAQLEALARRAPGSCEIFDRADRGCLAVSGFLGDARQIRSRSSRSRKSANRQQTLIVENDMNQILRRVPGKHTESSELHQQGAV